METLVSWSTRDANAIDSNEFRNRKRAGNSEGHQNKRWIGYDKLRIGFRKLEREVLSNQKPERDTKNKRKVQNQSNNIAKSQNVLTVTALSIQGGYFES